MAVGDTATDFELPDEAGAPRRLSDLLAAGPVVLFFYPAAMTGGCTAEACHFRDLATEFAEVGAQPVGISSDRPDKQNMFAAANGFGFRSCPTPTTPSRSPSAPTGPGSRGTSTPAARPS